MRDNERHSDGYRTIYRATATLPFWDVDFFEALNTNPSYNHHRNNSLSRITNDAISLEEAAGIVVANREMPWTAFAERVWGELVSP